MLRPRAVVIDQELSSTAAPLPTADVSALASEAQIIADCRAGNSAAWDSLFDNTTRRSPGLCFSSRAISATKTRKRSARKHFYQWSETYLHFRGEAHFKRGYCGSRRTRRWIIAKKREPQNEVETQGTFQSTRAKLMTNRRLIHRLETPVPTRYCRLPRLPAS
jgi:hypothetical protein